MKKVLSFATDFSLVCVLLMAFILPIVVSFNLMPKLYTEPESTVAKKNNANVLGTVAEKTSPNSFDLLTEASDIPGVTITKTDGVSTSLDLIVVPNKIVGNNVFLGNLINNSTKGTFKISLLKSPEVSDSFLTTLKLNTSTFDDSEVLVTLDTNQKVSLSLGVTLTSKINYSQLLKVVIERVGE